jgi:hypothetical protein
MVEECLRVACQRPGVKAWGSNRKGSGFFWINWLNTMTPASLRPYIPAPYLNVYVAVFGDWYIMDHPFLGTAEGRTLECIGRRTSIVPGKIFNVDSR